MKSEDISEWYKNFEFNDQVMRNNLGIMEKVEKSWLDSVFKEKFENQKIYISKFRKNLLNHVEMMKFLSGISRPTVKVLSVHEIFVSLFVTNNFPEFQFLFMSSSTGETFLENLEDSGFVKNIGILKSDKLSKVLIRVARLLKSVNNLYGFTHYDLTPDKIWYHPETFEIKIESSFKNSFVVMKNKTDRSVFFGNADKTGKFFHDRGNPMGDIYRLFRKLDFGKKLLSQADTSEYDHVVPPIFMSQEDLTFDKVMKLFSASKISQVDEISNSNIFTFVQNTEKGLDIERKLKDVSTSLLEPIYDRLRLVIAKNSDPIAYDDFKFLVSAKVLIRIIRKTIYRIIDLFWKCQLTHRDKEVRDIWNFVIKIDESFPKICQNDKKKSEFVRIFDENRD